MSNIVRTGGGISLSALLGARKAKALSERMAATLPLRNADRAITGEGISWWQAWMDHAEPGDCWWDAINYGSAVRSMPPAVMTGSWYDIFLPWQLRDFVNAQRAAGAGGRGPRRRHRGPGQLRRMTARHAPSVSRTACCKAAV